jgi:DNA repair photolyase
MRGRGAESNPTGRFEKRQLEPLHPEDVADPDWVPPVLQTEVIPEATRQIITTNDSPDVSFNRSINPYKGCEHGCIYCFARPTHAYLGLSPGLDFESKIFSKPQAPALLRNELGRRGYRCELIALGANTDPYQPVERDLGITRGILEVLAEHRHPVSIITKSHLVLRDLDLLREMARENLASVCVSITTLDPELARRMEPRAATPARRLEVVRDLSEAGVPVVVLAAPMIPGLNDPEMERILGAAAEAGARSAGYVLLRLPHEVKQLFEEWIREHYPTRADRVLHLVRECRGGELYDSSWGLRMSGTGEVATLLERRFTIACRKLGLTSRPSLDTTRFRVPEGKQKSLF